jgi:hypothetical protein
MGVGQHAGNQFISGKEPLNDLHAVLLVNGKAHFFIAFKISFNSLIT